MRKDLGWLHTREEVLAFGKKVEQLRADGMTYADIARRFGIGGTTLESRMQTYRAYLKQSLNSGP